jgi:GDP-L-fucose synthase
MTLSKDSKIVITGSGGLVGTALVERLKQEGYLNLYLPSRKDCDLTDFQAVKSLFKKISPDVVFHNAAAVFGIGGNLKNRGKIFLDNTLMNTHVIEASHLSGASKVIAMGTVAAYPDPKQEPVKEQQIWDGPPHGSESSYGHAKRAMLAQLIAYQENYGLDYVYAISTNLYGQNDKFDTQLGHVIPSLICKFYEAQKQGTDVVIWGDGTSARDFLYSKDMARALVLAMNHFSGPINIASGRKCMIRDVVDILTKYFGMEGKVKWDTKMPNGRKFYEVDLTHLRRIGFTPEYSIESGLLETLDWFSSIYEQNLVRK